MFKVVWDNGNHGSGELTGSYGSWDEADAAGKEWQADMNAIAKADGESDDDYEDGYTYDVVEVDDNGSTE